MPGQQKKLNACSQLKPQKYDKVNENKLNIFALTQKWSHSRKLCTSAVHSKQPLSLLIGQFIVPVTFRQCDENHFYMAFYLQLRHSTVI